MKRLLGCLFAMMLLTFADIFSRIQWRHVEPFAFDRCSCFGCSRSFRRRGVGLRGTVGFLDFGGIPPQSDDFLVPRHPTILASNDRLETET